MNQLTVSRKIFGISVNLKRVSINFIKASASFNRVSVNFNKTSFNSVESSVNFNETSYHFIEDSVNLSKASVKQDKTSVNPVEASVNFNETSINSDKTVSSHWTMLLYLCRLKQLLLQRSLSHSTLILFRHERFCKEDNKQGKAQALPGEHNNWKFYRLPGCHLHHYVNHLPFL